MKFVTSVFSVQTLHFSTQPPSSGTQNGTGKEPHSEAHSYGDSLPLCISKEDTKMHWIFFLS